jgi:hypothetical protein
MKKKSVLDLTTKSKLVDRQRKLWAHAEAIELAQQRQLPLPTDLSEWLHRALKNIAYGEDANTVFNVVPEKRGVRKDGFLREMQRKCINAYIAAATEAGPEKMTTEAAIKKISAASSNVKKATVRKNYNKVSTDRKPEFTIGKK